MATSDGSKRRRAAVITGGSQGLGLALARQLVTDGWAVVIDARRTDRLAAAEQQLSAAGSATVVAIAGDVNDPEHRRALADAARELGELALLVNNASTIGASPLPALDRIGADVLRSVLDTNVVAPIALVGELADQLGAGATVVNVSSDAAVGAYGGWGGYGASKAALDHASRVLAEEHPEWRVLAVDPGDLRTELHQQAFPGEDISDRPEPETSVPALVALIEGSQPSGRYEARSVISPPDADRADGSVAAPAGAVR